MKKFILLFITIFLMASCGVKGDLLKPQEAKYKRTYPKY